MTAISLGEAMDMALAPFVDELAAAMNPEAREEHRAALDRLRASPWANDPELRAEAERDGYRPGDWVPADAVLEDFAEMDPARIAPGTIWPPPGHISRAERDARDAWPKAAQEAAAKPSIEPNRAPIPGRVRFEVFKRDKFTCQYCGRKAPDVVLHCDHIDPRAVGGSNDILNLVTSCKDCNGGKGAVPLSDAAALHKQREMLAELEERRQQIEMMLAWRDSLQAQQQDAVDIVTERIAKRTGGTPNENGRALLRRWLQKFKLEEVLSAMDEAFDLYLTYTGDKVDDRSWEKAFRAIPRIAGLNKQAIEKPYIKRLAYIQGIFRKRTRAYRYDCLAYLEHLHLCGADLDWLENRAKQIRTIEEFEKPLDEWLAKIGRPF